MSKNSSKNIKISLLYSPKDKEYSDGLRKHLRAIKTKHRNVEFILIEDLPLGNQQTHLREVLKKSDIVLLLLSIDFLNENLLDGETRILLETQKKSRPNERFIMPIILRSFSWELAYEDQEIHKITVFREPISSSINKDEAYEKIVSTLNQHIEKLNASAIKMALPTWAGYLSAISYNKGFAKNKKTKLYEKYNKTIRIDLNDNHEDLLEAWKAGEADIIGVTMDTLPYLLEHYSELQPQIIFQASWSSGADAIIGRKGLNSVADLKGKRVICAKNTPSQYFLEQVMKKAGLSKYDVHIIHADIHTPDEAMACFKKEKAIEAVVLWSPYIESCLHDVAGTKILTDSKEFPNLITDVLVGSKNFIQLNSEELQEVIGGWIEENHRLNDDTEKKDEAVDVFVESILKPLPSLIPNKIRKNLKGVLVNYFDSALSKIHLCNYEDNARFFGIKPNQTSIGEQIFEGLEHKKKCSPWEDIINETIIQALKSDKEMIKA